MIETINRGFKYEKRVRLSPEFGKPVNHVKEGNGTRLSKQAFFFIFC